MRVCSADQGRLRLGHDSFLANRAGDWIEVQLVPEAGYGQTEGIETPIRHDGMNIGEIWLGGEACNSGSSPGFDILLAILAEAAAILRLTKSLATAEQKRKNIIAETEATRSSIATSQKVSRTGSWTWNPEKPAFGDWSQEVFDLLQYDPTCTSASFENNVARVHPDDRSRYIREAYEAVSQGLRLNVEYRYLLPDGTIKHVKALGRRIRSDLYVGTVADITERRAAEDTLRKTRSDLVRMSRLMAVGELATSITHQLNQPLTAIVADAAATLRWLDRDDPEVFKAKQGLIALLNDSRRARDIVGSLNALARKSEPEMALVDIDRAVGEMVQLASGELEHHGLKLEVSLGADRASVLGDRVQLQQVVLSLVLITIDLKRETSENQTVRLSTAAAADGSYVLSIRAVGVLDPAKETKGLWSGEGVSTQASGVGLSVCRSIIETHGGYFTAGTDEQGQLTLIVSLPPV
jgi:signal transduction histidine kinase